MAVLEGIQEFLDGAVLKGIDGDNLIMGQDDANRNGDIVGVAFVERVVFRWCFDDDQLDIFLFVKTGPFVDIGESVR